MSSVLLQPPFFLILIIFCGFSVHNLKMHGTVEAYEDSAEANSHQARKKTFQALSNNPFICMKLAAVVNKL